MTNYIFVILPYIAIPLYIYHQEKLAIKQFVKKHCSFLLAIIISVVLLPILSLNNLGYYALIAVFLLILLLNLYYYYTIYNSKGLSFFYLVTCIMVVGSSFLSLSEFLINSQLDQFLNLDGEIAYWLFFSIGSISMIGLMIEGFLCMLITVYKIIKNNISI